VLADLFKVLEAAVLLLHQCAHATLEKWDSDQQRGC
jgi:hypothetical protein